MELDNGLPSHTDYSAIMRQHTLPGVLDMSTQDAQSIVSKLPQRGWLANEEARQNIADICTDGIHNMYMAFVEGQKDIEAARSPWLNPLGLRLPFSNSSHAAKVAQQGIWLQWKLFEDRLKQFVEAQDAHAATSGSPDSELKALLMPCFQQTIGGALHLAQGFRSGFMPVVMEVRPGVAPDSPEYETIAEQAEARFRERLARPPSPPSEEEALPGGWAEWLEKGAADRPQAGPVSKR